MIAASQERHFKERSILPPVLLESGENRKLSYFISAKEREEKVRNIIKKSNNDGSGQG